MGKIRFFFRKKYKYDFISKNMNFAQRNVNLVERRKWFDRNCALFGTITNLI